MSASVVLTGLPQDAHRALADAEAIDVGKGVYYQLRLYILRHEWLSCFDIHMKSTFWIEG